MKTLIPFTLLCTVLLLVSACKKEDELFKTANLGEAFELKIGAQASINDQDFVVNFMDITEDSCCPTSSTCFWEGQAIAKFNLQISGSNQEIFLTARTGAPQEAETKIGDRIVRLVSVNPYPQNSTPIEKADYAISVVVE